MRKFLTLLFCTSITLFSMAQSADEIISKYLENIGGVESWKAVKSAKLLGTVPTPQGDFQFEMLRKAPNKFMISVDVMGQKLIPQAYDGENAWTLNPFMGDPNPQLLPDDQKKAIIQEADFEDAFIDYASKGHEAVYEGSADVDGIKCHQVKLIKNKGKADDELTITYFFDADTYLPLMVKQTPATGQMAGQEMDVYYSDYKDVGNGLIMPYVIDTRIGGQSVQAIKFDTIELNGEISDDVFKFPSAQ